MKNKKEIIDYMSNAIKGQDAVLDKIAYYIDVIKQPIKNIDRFTILMSGNSGTGKTLVAKKISEYITNHGSNETKFMPVVATEFSQEGYKGNSVAEFANNIKKVKENGITPILFIDEIDKLISSNLEFRQETFQDFLALINENYVILAGAFNNKTVSEIKTDINSISVELFTRIHDFIQFKEVNTSLVIIEIKKILSTRYPKTDFNFINNLLNSNNFKTTSYRDISRVVYEIDSYIYHNGLNNLGRVFK